jgi:hypothetical protein
MSRLDELPTRWREKERTWRFPGGGQPRTKYESHPDPGGPIYLPLHFISFSAMLHFGQQPRTTLFPTRANEKVGVRFLRTGGRTME